MKAANEMADALARGPSFGLEATKIFKRIK